MYLNYLSMQFPPFAFDNVLTSLREYRLEVKYVACVNFLCLSDYVTSDSSSGAKSDAWKISLSSLDFVVIIIV